MNENKSYCCHLVVALSSEAKVKEIFVCCVVMYTLLFPLNKSKK